MSNCPNLISGSVEPNHVNLKVSAGFLKKSDIVWPIYDSLWLCETRFLEGQTTSDKLWRFAKLHIRRLYKLTSFFKFNSSSLSNVYHYVAADRASAKWGGVPVVVWSNHHGYYIICMLIKFEHLHTPIPYHYHYNYQQQAYFDKEASVITSWCMTRWPYHVSSSIQTIYKSC